VQAYHIQLPTTSSAVAEDAPMLTKKSLQEEGVEVGFQDGMIETVDSNEEYSDVGSLKSEDECELEEYCKKIEQEDIVEEEGKLDVEASSQMAGSRRGKCHVWEANVEVGSKAERLKALRNEGQLRTAPSFDKLDDASVISNLLKLGISLGSDESTANFSSK
jgi:hypothetical protein